MSDRRGLRRGLGVLVLGRRSRSLGGTLLGSGDGDRRDGIDAWPPVVRAALVGLSVAIGLALARPGRDDAGGRGAVGRVDGRGRPRRPVDDPGGPPGVPGSRRVCRRGGWLFGQEFLLVVAVVIAGVDVIETTFLLLVARTHHGDDQSES